MKGHIRQRGARSFELKFDAGRDAAGNRITEYRSFKGAKREAQIELAKRIAAVSKGEHVARSPQTIGDYVASRIEQWVALKQIGAKTEMRYRELLDGQIKPHLGGVPLQALKATDIETWHRTLLTAGRKDGRGGLSAQTIKHAHRLLGKALKEAQRFDLVVRNVVSLQPAPRITREEVTILSREQIRDIMEKLRHRMIYPKAVIALFTGMRRGELLALRWGSIDFERKIISVKEALEETDAIRFKAPKSAAGKRDIMMPDVVLDTLRALRKQEQERRLALGLGKLTDDLLIFTRLDGSPQSPLTLSKEWRKAATSAGLSGISFHALRHTHASALIDAGIDVVKISKRLGHANPTITLTIYAHLFAKREDKSAQAINEAVAALLSV
jgi:integrase